MNRFLQLNTNKKGRDFVIGDIHGRYDALMYGLDQVEFDFYNDRLIAVGDLIDRGIQNMECLKLIWENWFYTVAGNHEQMMADAVTETPNGYTGRNLAMFWINNGGKWYYNIDDKDIEILKDIYAPYIYNEIPLAIELIAENGMRIGITHAGLPKAWTWTQTRKHIEDTRSIEDIVIQNCLWTRDRIQKTNTAIDILGVDLLINGHTPSIKEVWRGNNVFIDLGACNNGQLTPINVMDLLNRKDKNEHYAWKN